MQAIQKSWVRSPHQEDPLEEVIDKKKKDVQLESYKLSFIWGKMRTAAGEAAAQIALRDCSKVAMGESQLYKVLVTGEFNTMKHSFYERFFFLVLRV